MDNSKRARSEKSRTLPRDRAYVAPAHLQSALRRIRQAACRDKELRFTSLWHHVYNVDRLRKAYFKLRRKAAAGVDHVTWQQYGEDLEDNLRNLSERLQRGACISHESGWYPRMSCVRLISFTYNKAPLVGHELTALRLTAV